MSVECIFTVMILVRSRRHI